MRGITTEEAREMYTYDEAVAFAAKYEKLRKRGMTEKEIADAMTLGYIGTLRWRKVAALKVILDEHNVNTEEMKKQGYSSGGIAIKVGDTIRKALSEAVCD